MEEFPSCGAGPGGLGTKVPQWDPGTKPRYGCGDEVPQKLKKNVKFVYNFKRFPVENLGFNEYRSKQYILSWFGQYILRTHNSKYSKDTGGF